MDKQFEIDHVHCSKPIIEMLSAACKKKGINAPIMVSGAGHDAMLLAEITEIGMVFVRCEKGISHHPSEKAEKEDIAIGVELLLEVVLQNI